MAEFQDVMREYVRSRKTKHFDEPLLPWKPSQMTGAAIEAMEKVVQEWSKANPVPEYPTWAEWLIEQGVLGAEPYKVKAAGHDGAVVLATTKSAFKSIPADIAERLGVKPKS